MATYAIGDVHGCFQSLLQLLNKIQFDPKNDFLWFTGDLINRGPHSLETLRFIKELDHRAITVLGNHDFTLLAVGYGMIPFNPRHHTFEDILNASDRVELLDWLRHQPLMHHDPILGYTLVHAGLYPCWDLPLALSLAQEVETLLRDARFLDFFPHLYGNEPDVWDPKLTGWDRLRFIVNCFTRLRFCHLDGRIELSTKEPIYHNSDALPWFEIPNRLNSSLKIIFGHWASLEGRSSVPNIFALDTGCVWGNALTAMRLEDGKRFREPCQATIRTDL